MRHTHRSWPLRPFVLVAIALLASLFVGTHVAWADPSDPSAVISDEPQHGIPLVLVYIDESESALANARAADENHVYGTISDMNASEDHSVRCVGSVRTM